jgi:hypothetical protein
MAKKLNQNLKELKKAAEKVLFKSKPKKSRKKKNKKIPIDGKELLLIN